LSANFKGDLKRATLVGSALAFVAVFGLWGSTNWAPTLVRELPEFQGADSAALTRSVSYAIMALNTGAIFGYLAFGPLADRFGRRGGLCVHVYRQLYHVAHDVSSDVSLQRRLAAFTGSRFLQQRDF
jgi:MFS family permease